MHRIYRVTFAACFIGLAWMPGRAEAQQSYMYVAGLAGASPAPGTAALTVTPGATVSVELYLREQTVTGSSLVATEQGLFGAGVSVSRMSGSPSSPAVINSLTGDPAFDGTRSTLGTTSTVGLLNENVGPSDTAGPVGVDAGAGVRLVPLGTISLTAGSVAGQTTTFTVGPFGGSGNTLTFTNGYDLDVTNNGSAAGPPIYTGAASSIVSITSAVPEPSAIAACLATAGAVMLRRRRENRACTCE